MDNLNLIDKGIELNNSTNDLSLDEIMENDYVPSNLDIDNNNEITTTIDDSFANLYTLQCLSLRKY